MDLFTVSQISKHRKSKKSSYIGQEVTIKSRDVLADAEHYHFLSKQARTSSSEEDKKEKRATHYVVKRQEKRDFNFRNTNRILSSWLVQWYQTLVRIDNHKKILCLKQGIFLLSLSHFDIIVLC